MKRGKPRQVSYLYRCRACLRVSRRGSNAKRCDLRHYVWSKQRSCRGLLDRMKTVKGPVPVKLKVTG